MPKTEVYPRLQLQDKRSAKWQEHLLKVGTLVGINGLWSSTKKRVKSFEIDIAFMALRLILLYLGKLEDMHREKIVYMFLYIFFLSHSIFIWMFYASFHGQKVPGKSFSDRFTGFAQCERSTVHLPWNGMFGTSGTRKKKYGNSTRKKMAMGQYLYIPFLGGWTSIYQLFWCELQGDRVLTHPQMGLLQMFRSELSQSSSSQSSHCCFPRQHGRLWRSHARRCVVFTTPCWVIIQSGSYSITHYPLQ